jgi:hypothetical protein
MSDRVETDKANARRRGFTPAAREAAAATRRARADARLAIPIGSLELYIVREGAEGYGWEIRRFGAIAVSKGTSVYATMELAREAGIVALAPLRSTEVAWQIRTVG